MKSILRWLSRCHFPLLFLLGAYPLVLALLFIASPDLPPAVPALLLSPLPASMLLAWIPARRRLPAAALLSALIVISSAQLLPLRAHPLLCILPVLCCALLFFSLSFISRGIHGVSPVLFAIGTGAHIFAAVLFRAPGPETAALKRYLTFAFYAYLPLLFLALNRITLDNASLSRFRLPASMQRANILLTLAFLLLSLLVASAPAAAKAFFALWRTMRDGLRAIGALILSFLPSAPASGGGGIGAAMQPAFSDVDIVSPSLFSIILERVSLLLAYAALAAGSVILLRLLCFALFRLIRRAIASLQRYAAAAAEDYEDEITDTREEDGQRQSMFPFRLRRRDQEQTPDTPAAVIRFRYARLMKKHAAWSESSTARENLPQDAASIYERARYSDHPVTKEDTDAFLHGTKKL